MRAETKRTSPSPSTPCAPGSVCAPAERLRPATAAPAGGPPASPPAGPPAGPPHGRGGGGRRTPAANAFSPAFLEAARRRHEAACREPESTAAFAAGGSLDGPFDVEPFAAPHGPAWAVVRRGEPVAGGHAPVAIFRDRTAALLAAAVLPAGAAPNRLDLHSAHLGDDFWAILRHVSG